MCEKGSSGPTFADISNWLAGGEEENIQIMTDEEIINNVLQDDHSKNEQVKYSTDYPQNTTR
jgi:hypothetical protein